jgi:hypothetical protein
MIALFRAALPLIVASCASDPDRLTTPKVASGIEIAPFAIHEQCFALAAGERVAYRFTAAQPVAFNVHFRESNATVVPVDVRTTLAEDGDFTADEGRNYCLAWEAGAQGSVVDYRVQQVRPRR